MSICIYLYNIYTIYFTSAQVTLSCYRHVFVFLFLCKKRQKHNQSISYDTWNFLTTWKFVNAIGDTSSSSPVDMKKHIQGRPRKPVISRVISPQLPFNFYKAIYRGYPYKTPFFNDGLRRSTNCWTPCLWPDDLVDLCLSPSHGPRKKHAETVFWGKLVRNLMKF